MNEKKNNKKKCFNQMLRPYENNTIFKKKIEEKTKKPKKIAIKAKKIKSNIFLKDGKEIATRSFILPNLFFQKMSHLAPCQIY